LQPRGLEESLAETVAWLRSASLLANRSQRGRTPVAALVASDVRARDPEDS
jgi:hypothetical protein